MDSEYKAKFKETKKRMIDKIVAKEIERERKKLQERLARGEPREQSALKKIANKLSFRMRLLARMPFDFDDNVAAVVEQEEMLAEAKLTEEERKAKREAERQERRRKIPKKIAYALAGYALMINFGTFAYTALGLTSGHTKQQIENTLKFNRQYIFNGWLGDEFTPPYPEGYEPKETKVYVREKDLQSILSEEAKRKVQPGEPKTKWVAIKQDETGKEYVDYWFTTVEKILKCVLLNPISKPGRELAYQIIKPTEN